MYATGMRAFHRLAVGALALLGGSAAAADSGLKLEQGDIFTNDVGTVMGVSVVNNTPATVGSVAVSCAFTLKGDPVGSASTTLYNIVAGAKGQDQVHLLGPKADAATCSITSTGAPLN